MKVFKVNVSVRKVGVCVCAWVRVCVRACVRFGLSALILINEIMYNVEQN